MVNELIVLPPEIRNALIHERKLRGGWERMDLAMAALVAESSVARAETGIPVPARLVRAMLESVHMDFPGDNMVEPMSDNTVDLLGLLPHPEGGWYRETWRSGVEFEPAGYEGSRATATAIYFLLRPGEVSRWHVVKSDELWFWHSGGPLTLRLREDDIVTEVTLGPDLVAGQRPQVLVPGGVWQAAEPAGGVQVLVSCVVAPGFDFADFSMDGSSPEV